MGVFLAKFLICAVLADFHLIWLVSQSSWFEAVVHGLLDSDVDTVVFVVFGHTVKVDGFAVDVDGILTVPEDHDVVLEILGVKGRFIEEIAKLLLIDEYGFLKQGYCIVVFLEGVVFQDLVLKMEQVSFVD